MIVKLQNNETQYSKIMRALINFSSSHQKYFVKKGVLKNFANFTGNQFNFPVEFEKFLRTPILKNICKLLFLRGIFFKDKLFPDVKVQAARPF